MNWQQHGGNVWNARSYWLRIEFLGAIWYESYIHFYKFIEKTVDSLFFFNQMNWKKKLKITQNQLEDVNLSNFYENAVLYFFMRTI